MHGFLVREAAVRLSEPSEVLAFTSKFLTILLELGAQPTESLNPEDIPLAAVG